MSTTYRISPPTALTEVPYLFTNTFNQLPPLTTFPSPGYPLTVEASSTPGFESINSAYKTFADPDGEVDHTDEYSDNPGLPPPEKLNQGDFKTNTPLRIKGTENVRRFRPVTPTQKASRTQFAMNKTPDDISGMRIWHSGFFPSKTAPEVKIAVDVTALVVERGMWNMGRLMEIIGRPRPRMEDLVAREGRAWERVAVNGGHIGKRRGLLRR